MDPGRFASPAEAYDHHVGRYGSQLAAGLIDVAAVRPGQRVLDVGCGPGALTRALAERAGAANVAAVDPSPDFTVDSASPMERSLSRHAPGGRAGASRRTERRSSACAS
jgi:trans-aconitate methyltransferase